jgi:hypothetical protein
MSGDGYCRGASWRGSRIDFAFAAATGAGVEPSALSVTAGVELLTWLSVVPHVRALLVEAL